MTRRSSRDELAELRDELSKLRELFGGHRREVLEQLARKDQEHPDPTPVEIPVHLDGPRTMESMIQDAIAQQLAMLTGVSPPMDPDPEGEDWTEDDPDHLALTVDEMVELAEEGQLEAPESRSEPQGELAVAEPSSEPAEPAEALQGRPGAPGGGEAVEAPPVSPASQ